MAPALTPILDKILDLDPSVRVSPKELRKVEEQRENDVRRCFETPRILVALKAPKAPKAPKVHRQAVRSKVQECLKNMEIQEYICSC